MPGGRRMNPFEFIIIFFAFVYSLALAHLLFAWTRMIRHRRQLTFSWPHLLWMLVAMFLLAVDWLSTWDYRTFGKLSLLEISSVFLFVMLNYFFCALVSPDFEGGETFDLKRFHDAEGRTYILVFLATVTIAIVENFLAGEKLGITKEGAENALVLFQWPLGLLPLFVKRSWVQIVAPAAILVTIITYAAMFYPVLMS
jgi:hypothetical protein